MTVYIDKDPIDVGITLNFQIGLDSMPSVAQVLLDEKRLRELYDKLHEHFNEPHDYDVHEDLDGYFCVSQPRQTERKWFDYVAARCTLRSDAERIAKALNEAEGL